MTVADHHVLGAEVAQALVGEVVAADSADEVPGARAQRGVQTLDCGYRRALSRFAFARSPETVESAADFAEETGDCRKNGGTRSQPGADDDDERSAEEGEADQIVRVLPTIHMI